MCSLTPSFVPVGTRGKLPCILLAYQAHIGHQSIFSPFSPPSLPPPIREAFRTAEAARYPLEYFSVCVLLSGHKPLGTIRENHTKAAKEGPRVVHQRRDPYSGSNICMWP